MVTKFYLRSQYQVESNLVNLLVCQTKRVAIVIDATCDYSIASDVVNLTMRLLEQASSKWVECQSLILAFLVAPQVHFLGHSNALDKTSNAIAQSLIASLIVKLDDLNLSCHLDVKCLHDNLLCLVVTEILSRNTRICQVFSRTNPQQIPGKGLPNFHALEI
jgi:hypothetical protein